jgi:hypothetical protein
MVDEESHGLEKLLTIDSLAQGELVWLGMAIMPLFLVILVLSELLRVVNITRLRLHKLALLFTVPALTIAC